MKQPLLPFRQLRVVFTFYSTGSAEIKMRFGFTQSRQVFRQRTVIMEAHRRQPSLPQKPRSGLLLQKPGSTFVDTGMHRNKEHRSCGHWGEVGHIPTANHTFY